MGLESLTGSTVYLDSLVITNPVGATDPKSQGDDHLRGIKNVLANTFPNITGIVSATHTELSLLTGCTADFTGKTGFAGGGAKIDAFATGTEMPFYQAAAPTGWTQNTTKANHMLRVVATAGGGSGGTISPITMSHTHTDTLAAPAHTHTGPSHTHTGGGHSLTEAELAVHDHVVTARNIGAGGSTTSINSITTSGAGDAFVDSAVTAANAGSGTSHSHGTTSASGTASTGAASATALTGSVTTATFVPQYIDMIICAKDA